MQAVTRIDETAIEALKQSVRGEMLQPGDEGYETARKVYNGMIDKHPALIVRCADVTDVMSAVNFGRERKLDISIRGGGHNVVGFASNDGGLVIDLSHMKGVWLDLEKGTVHAQGGVTWGDLDHATHPFGMAVPGGIISTTGIAGLTLGGGVGNLTRTYGLTCDSLVSAEVVTADGRLLTVSADEHPDLFWALCGGGGNFGVVTSFEYRLRRAGTILGGFVAYPLDRARDAMQFYRTYLEKAPNEVNAYFAFHMLPPAPFIPENLHLQRVCMIIACCVAPQEQAEKMLQPIRQYGPPLLDMISPMPLPALNSIFDALLPPGLFHYWKAHFVNELSDAAIDTYVTHGSRIPNFQSAMHLYPVNGAAHDVAEDATAFSHRKANWVANIASMGPEDGLNTRIQWTRDYWDALRPYSDAGTYINFLGEEGEDRLKASYGSGYDRLRAVKRTYDPNNLFHVNQNIKPAP